MTFIWATRGRTWGFRFLRGGGYSDPLPEYDRVLGGLTGVSAWCRVDDAVGLRFPDPLGRVDAAGRVIPHEFVVSGDLALDLESVSEGVSRLWPLVAEEFARVWDAEPAEGLQGGA